MNDATPGPAGPTVLAAQARAAVDAIVAAGAVTDQSRQHRLLSHLVEETLAGRDDRLKAYAIGLDVLDRTEDFDPGADSIVRVEVNRLRQTLGHYYATAGARDPVAIAIPKGGYRVAFRRRRPARPAAQAWWRRALAAAAAALCVVAALGAAWFGGRDALTAPARPELLRLWIVAEGDGAAQAAAIAVRDSLSRHVLYTVAQDGAPPAQPTPEDFRVLLRGGGAVALGLDVAPLAADAAIVASAALLGENGAPPDPRAIGLQAERLFSFAGPVVAFYRALGDPSRTMACAFALFDYRAAPGPGRLDAVHDCAAAAAQDGVDTLALSLVRADAALERHLLRDNVDDGAALAQASALTRATLRRFPDNASAHLVAMATYALRGEAALAHGAGATAQRLAPFSAQVAVSAATWLNAIGAHDAALEALDRAATLNPGRMDDRAYGYFIAHFASGDPQAACGAAAKLGDSAVPLHIAARAICAAQAGDADAADALRARAGAGNPLLAADPEAAFARHSYRPGLAHRLAASFGAAD